MIQSATHVRKWLCDIRENSLKAPRFIYGLSKPCMFVFRFRGLSLWSTSLGERHSSMQGKCMKVPCAPMCIFVWPCGRKPRCFSTFFCQARRNARLCPQKIRRLWISKQSKQDIHKISLNFIGNSFLRNILHESHGWFINFKDTHRRAKALSFFDLPCGAIFSMRSNCMTSMILQKLCNMICKNHIHCINTDQSWSLSHCFQSDSFIVVILCQNGWSNVVFNDDEMEYPRSNSYNNFFWAPEGQYFAPWFNLVQLGSTRFDARHIGRSFGNRPRFVPPWVTATCCLEAWPATTRSLAVKDHVIMMANTWQMGNVGYASYAQSLRFVECKIDQNWSK